MTEETSPKALGEAAGSLLRYIHENGNEAKSDGVGFRLPGAEKTWTVFTNWPNPSDFSLQMILDFCLEQGWLNMGSTLTHYRITAQGLEMLEGLQ